MFIRNVYEKTTLSSSSLYRLMSNHRYNWRRFQLKVARRILLKLEPDKTQKKNPVFFVLDDTVRKAEGKLIEKVSYIFDHTIGRSVLGFDVLILGLFNGEQFFRWDNV